MFRLFIDATANQPARDSASRLVATVVTWSTTIVRTMRFDLCPMDRSLSFTQNYPVSFFSPSKVLYIYVAVFTYSHSSSHNTVRLLRTSRLCGAWRQLSRWYDTFMLCRRMPTNWQMRWFVSNGWFFLFKLHRPHFVVQMWRIHWLSRLQLGRD